MQRLTGVLLVVLSFGCGGTQESGKYRTLDWDVFVDKVDGGWLGQMIGVAFGRPTEFRWVGEIAPWDLDDYLRVKPEYRDNPEFWTELWKKPHAVRRLFINDRSNWEYFQPDGALDNDDTYIELLFLHALTTYGIDVTQRQVAEHWLKYMNYKRVFCANKAGHTNFMNGIWPPQSGMRQYNEHCDDIDFRIEADLIGFLCPGLPQESNRWGAHFGTLMNSGEGLYGGVFMAGMYGIAYFEQNPETIVRYGLRCIPPDSKFHAKITQVLDSWKSGASWQDTWRAVWERWDEDNECPWGRGELRNIDCGLNSAFMVIGLLYGNGDFQQTMNLAIRCGQDSDCNSSGAAGILGVAYGASQLPEKFSAPMKDFVHNQSMSEIYPERIPRKRIVDDTITIAMQIITRAGGEVVTGPDGKKTLRIPWQEPVAYQP